MMKLIILTIFLFYKDDVLGATNVALQNDVISNNNEPVSNILENLSLHTSNVLDSSQIAPQNTNNGPISNIMENLASHTSSVTDELLNQLISKIERTTKTIIGNIEVIVASALNQLSAPVMEAQNKINSPECQATLSIEDLQQRLDSSLVTCTSNLSDILQTFQDDADEFKNSLDLYVKEIMELPNQCQNLDDSTGFGGSLSCYVEKIAGLNQQIAAVLNRASMTLVHTRQLAEQSVEAARLCSDEVVVDTLEYLNDILSTCDVIEN